METPKHGRRLICLATLVALSHGWLIWNSLAPAPDTLRFITLAQQIGQGQFIRTVRKESDHPLYPLAVTATEKMVRGMTGAESPEGWRVAAQLAATLSAVLLILPVYGIALELFGPRIAFWAALTFALLPVPNRVTADGVSDGLHLLWFTSAIWTALVASRTRQPRWLLLTGVLAGLGFWTRLEALVLLAAVCIWCVAVQLTSRARWPWKSAVMGMTGLVASFALTILPYVLLKGEEIAERASLRSVLALRNEPRRVARDDGSSRSTSTVAAIDTESATGKSTAGLVQPIPEDLTRAAVAAIRPRNGALHELLIEFVDAAHYVFPAFALWALIVPWAPRSRKPEAYLLGVVALLYVLLLLRLGVATGYVASRHTLVLVVAMCPWAASGLVLVADRLARVAQRWGSRVASPTRCGQVARLAWLVLLVFGCLPKMLEPMHLSRWGHRQAAVWLQEHSPRGAAVLDHHAFAAFYSGLRRYSYRELESALSDPELHYVVVETNDLRRTKPMYLRLRQLVGTLGPPQTSFPMFEGGSQADVFVYSYQPSVALERFPEEGRR